MRIKLFEEFTNESNNGWVGKEVKGKGGKKGEIIHDDNPGARRTLTIQWEDGSKYDLILNNVGQNPPDKEDVEWEWSKGKWAKLAESESVNENKKGSTINVGSKIMLKHEKGYSEIEARDWWDTASEKQRISFLEENGGYSDKYANYNWSSLSPAVKDEVIQVKGKINKK